MWWLATPALFPWHYTIDMHFFLGEFVLISSRISWRMSITIVSATSRMVQSRTTTLDCIAYKKKKQFEMRATVLWDLRYLVVVPNVRRHRCPYN